MAPSIRIPKNNLLITMLLLYVEQQLNKNHDLIQWGIEALLKDCKIFLSQLTNMKVSMGAFINDIKQVGGGGISKFVTLEIRL